MNESLDWIRVFLAICGIVLTILVPLLASIFNSQKNTAKELSDHKTHVAENYATKDDVKDLGDRIERQMKDGFTNLKDFFNNRKNKDAA
ncbi:hypothetical protein ACVBIO_03395 [Shewanella sp. 0m-8]